MKHSAGLLLASGLTTVVVIIVTVLGLFLLSSPTQANQWPLSFGVNQVNIEATAQAIQFLNQKTETEAVAQQGETSLLAQVTEREQVLHELDRGYQAQIADLNARLVDMQAQLNQAATNVEVLQSRAVQLQQAIQQDDATYQDQLVTIQRELAGAEKQVQSQLATTNVQLQEAYNALAQRQAAAAATGGWVEREHDGDDHDDYEDHDDHDDDRERENHDEGDHGSDHEDD